MRRALAALLLAVPLAVVAQSPEIPTITAIVFEGNQITRAKVMARELVVRVGDPAEPAALERSRQGLLDLGLFRRVYVRTEPSAGGVRVVFQVDERYYFLPLPRADAKSDGRYSYGAQLRWDNVAGLNHRLRLLVEEEDQQRQGIGKETHFSAGYSAPFAFDSPYHLSVGTGYSTRPVEGTAGDYTEDFRSFGFAVARTFADGGPASQGLSVGGGLAWRQQRTRGAFAPAPYGDALAPSLSVGHTDYHSRIYSDIGRSWNLRLEVAEDGVGSDYSYLRLDGGFLQSLDLGATPHQTLQLRARTGLYFAGPEGVRQYGLGGSSYLRGYDSNFTEGNAYYYLSAEFARPLGVRWLRGVLIAEVGNVFARPEDSSAERAYASLGAGIRLRFSHFVDFEVELGYAIPLDGGRGRVFAGRV